MTHRQISIIMYVFSVAASMSLHIARGSFAPEEHTPPPYQTRTLKYLIAQEDTPRTSPSTVIHDFSVFMGETSPVIRSAYIEIRGIGGGSAQSITVDVRSTQGGACAESFLTSRSRSFSIAASSIPSSHVLLYEGNTGLASLRSCLEQVLTAPGNYPFQLRIDASDMSLLQARLIITYQFAPPTESGGALPAVGTLISSTYDTGTVNGADFNSMMWRGIKPPGTRVRLQFAASNAPSGPFLFIGPDCSAGTYFEQNAGLFTPIGCPAVHTNKRYFRYRLQLCSNTDCATSGLANPQVEDVFINWSI